ncbi:methyltransferase type 11 [Halobacteriales archaeon SW_7_71_33]|nr:MAG: methyltransferase type 11 [Halobacteriales archaeon SW_7_71_33]
MTPETRPDAAGDGAGSRPTADVERFYGRWAGLYDPIARRFPRVRAVREAVADACRLAPGDTVVEMGCGTGANVPYLRERVAPGGRVVGLDVTAPALRRARRRAERRSTAHDGDDVTVAFARADAGDPPVSGPVDAVVGTFVSGMFADAAAVVDGWCDLAADGHVVLADGTPSRRLAARPLNTLFRAVTVVSTPPTTRLRYERDLLTGLRERVDAAHGRLRERSTATASREFLLGFVRLTGGRVE